MGHQIPQNVERSAILRKMWCFGAVGISDTVGMVRHHTFAKTQRPRVVEIGAVQRYQWVYSQLGADRRTTQRPHIPEKNTRVFLADEFRALDREKVFISKRAKTPPEVPSYSRLLKCAWLASHHASDRPHRDDPREFRQVEGAAVSMPTAPQPFFAQPLQVVANASPSLQDASPAQTHERGSTDQSTPTPVGTPPVRRSRFYKALKEIEEILLEEARQTEQLAESNRGTESREPHEQGPADTDLPRPMEGDESAGLPGEGPGISETGGGGAGGSSAGGDQGDDLAGSDAGSGLVGDQQQVPVDPLPERTASPLQGIRPNKRFPPARREALKPDRYERRKRAVRLADFRAAVAFAYAMDWPLNIFITLTWPALLEAGEHNEGHCLGRGEWDREQYLRDELARLCRPEAFPFVALWGRDVGKDMGLHVHLAMYWPGAKLLHLVRLIERISGSRAAFILEPYAADTVAKSVCGGWAITMNNRRDSKAGALDLAAYIADQHAKHPAPPTITGKAFGTSEAIGKKAQAAIFRKRQRSR